VASIDRGQVETNSPAALRLAAHGAVSGARTSIKEQRMTGFNEALLSPGEVARQFGVTTKQVANWDNDGILKAAFRTPGGQRRYREADVARLRSNPPSDYCLRVSQSDDIQDKLDDTRITR
jgi:hypothetical protein